MTVIYWRLPSLSKRLHPILECTCALDNTMPGKVPTWLSAVAFAGGFAAGVRPCAGVPRAGARCFCTGRPCLLGAAAALPTPRRRTRFAPTPDPLQALAGPGAATGTAMVQAPPDSQVRNIGTFSGMQQCTLGLGQTLCSFWGRTGGVHLWLRARPERWEACQRARLLVPLVLPGLAGATLAGWCLTHMCMRMCRRMLTVLSHQRPSRMPLHNSVSERKRTLVPVKHCTSLVSEGGSTS